MFAKLNSGHGTRWFLDHINYVDDAVSSLQYFFQSGPVTNWIIDRVVQDYWVPNSEIILSKKKIGSVSSELSLHYSHTR